MAYDVKLYKNTGFNTVNIPDGPDKLPEAFISKTGIDAIQNRVIEEITLRCTNFDEVKDVDYAQVGDFYYIVNGVEMLASDVCKLSLTPDFITSAGGINNISFLDGITERYHVSEDNFGEYTEDDELISPSRPLIAVHWQKPFWNKTTAPIESNNTIILSTVDLTSEETKAFTYLDDSTSADKSSVTVPALTPSSTSMSTVFKVGSNFNEEDTENFSIVGIQAFFASIQKINAISTGNDVSGEVVLKGLQRARDLAAETSIINQYRIPQGFIKIERAIEGDDTSPLVIKGIANEGEMSFDDDPAAESMKFIYADVQNKRLLYGEFSKYGLITMNGNKIEGSPEDIYKEGNTYPELLFFVDPRQDGKPYFRFKYIDQDENPNEYSKWIGCVAGEQWAQVPLIFTTLSGAENIKYTENLAEKITVASNRVSDIKRDASMLGYAGDTITNLGRAYNNVSTPYTTDELKNPYRVMSRRDMTMQAAGGAFGSFSNLLGSTFSATTERNIAKMSLEKEMYELGVSFNVVVPTIMFPYTKGAIRDFMGNGVIEYRYRMDDMDLKRCDKLLNAYGYKNTAILDKSMFFTRQYFNFVMAKTVSIGGDLPQWFKQGIAKQLTGGIRVWHVKPNESYYTTGNPIV